MTRKDYELIAKVISGQVALFDQGIRTGAPENTETYRQQKWGVKTLAYELAGELKKDNARFNTDTFLKACGL